VCSDDHCQRYQGITKAFSAAAAKRFARQPASFSRYNGAICDARFSKSCGGITERYASAWEDEDIPYLESVYDGPAQPAPTVLRNGYAPTRLRTAIPTIRNSSHAFCRDSIRRPAISIGGGSPYTPEELADLIRSRLAVDLGPIREVQALARGPSGRIYRLKVTGERDCIIIGKELEIRRALSSTHLYSSAFVVDKEPGRYVLRGAGWGHGVGLCQIGAQSWQMRARLTSKSCNITIAGPLSASDVRTRALRSLQLAIPATLTRPRKQAEK